MNDPFKFTFKSLPCWSMPPQVVILETVGENDEVIGRRVFGRTETICPHCSRQWKDHEGNSPRPKEF